ncbi:MAG: GAF domain-containing protein [Bacteroidales bacterium]|nr:GAF domain-containing protein [Bacteroidales bacterium]
MQLQRNILIAILLLFSSAALTAQQFGFHNFSLEEGLPQTEVFALIQDTKGSIWVGTNGGGLSRFTGQNFETYTTQDGMASNQIWSLFEDSRGNLWMGCSNYITSYDGVSFKNYGEAPVPFLRNYILFHEDPDGNIWSISNDEQSGRRLLKIENDSIIDYTGNFPDLTDNNAILFGFRSESDGTMYLPTLNGLYELNAGKVTLSSLNQRDELNGGIIASLFRDDEYLVLALITPNDRRFCTFDGKLIQMVETPSTAWWQGVGRYFKDSKGRQWFGTNGQGIAMRETDQADFQYFNQNNGLPSDFVLSFLEDHEGNIWMGTQGNGIIKYSKSNFIAYNFENIIQGDVVRSIYQDSQGNHWFGLAGTGFVKYDGENYTAYQNSRFPGLNMVRDFVELSPGKLLVVSFGGLFHLENGNLTSVNNQYGFRIPLPFSNALRDENTIWISTQGAGLFKITDGQQEQFSMANSDLPSNQIHSLFQDDHGNIWAATNSGISKYDGEELKTYTIDDGLSNNIIIQITQDNFGKYWIASFGGGVNILSGGQFKHLTTEDGLSSNIIYSILTDPNGDIWAGSQNGVDKIVLDGDGQLKEIIHHGVYDGFTGIENNGAANFVDRDNNLWFGTVKGAMRYDPNQIEINTVPPFTHITKVKLFFNEVNWRSGDYDDCCTNVSAWFALPENLVFPHDSNHLSFEFEALSYQVPEKVKYQWKLEGLDKEWSPITTKTECVYPNIPPGEYTFLVRAQNNDGIWTVDPAKFSFVINPPWWGRWWFILLVSIVILATVAIIFRMRIQMINAKKEELEVMVREKTAEILKKNTMLEQQKEEILVQSENLQKAYDDLENLSDIGKVITSQLSVEKIVDAAYLSINELMEANVFAIGIVNQQDHTIEFHGVKEKYETLPPIILSLDDDLRLSTYCVKSRSEIFINDFEKEYKRYLPSITPPGEAGNSSSIIYLPLLINKRVEGVITVQSFNKDAYTEYHLNILRNLAVYTRIAMENATAYHRIQEQKNHLKQANEDISEQKKKIEMVNQELVELNNEKNHLIGIVAHDLRNPLTSSLSIASNLKMNAAHLKDEDKKSVDFLVNSLNRMNSMVSKILDIRMIEENKINLNCEQTDFGKVLEEVYKNFQDRAIKKKIQLHLENKKLYAIADRNYLTQVFENLLSNAIKFSPPERNVWIKMEEQNGEILINFKDEGPGLTEEDKKLIFRKFQRLSARPSAGEKSTGLGLSIVKKYVDIMGGRVWCESTPGAGANFFVSFQKAT